MKIHYSELTLCLGALGFPYPGKKSFDVFKQGDRVHASMTCSNLEDGKTISLHMKINDYAEDGSKTVYKTKLIAERIPNETQAYLKITDFVFENEQIDVNDHGRIKDILTSKLSNQVRSFPRPGLRTGGVPIYTKREGQIVKAARAARKFLKKRFGP